MLAASTVRRVVATVCVVSVAGMIVSSIGDHNGAAMAFGLSAAVAILCLMVATAVAPGPRPSTAEDEAARVEDLVDNLVAQGADEPVVRALVRAAVRLGRSQSRPTTGDEIGRSGEAKEHRDPERGGRSTDPGATRSERPTEPDVKSGSSEPRDKAAGG